MMMVLMVFIHHNHTKSDEWRKRLVIVHERNSLTTTLTKYVIKQVEDILEETTSITNDTKTLFHRWKTY